MSDSRKNPNTILLFNQKYSRVKIVYFKNVIALGASAGYVQSCAATDSHGKIYTLKLKMSV
jgi:hypothetical protein